MGGSTTSDNGHNQVLWALVNIVSCIPMALSSVYKEKALQGQAIDVVYLNGWVAVFQMLLSLPLSFPSAMAVNLPISELPSNFIDGWRCFLGHSSVYEESALSMRAVLNATLSSVGAGASTGTNPPVIVDQCSMAPFYVTGYLIFNIAYNILVVVILKYGSANIMYLGSTALVPLTNFAFSLDWVPGHQPVRPTDLIGLVVIMTGIFLYRFVGTETTPEHPPAQRRRALYIGLNSSMESLQPLIDTRIWREMATSDARLRKSPAQIRSNYMARLGLPPSPAMANGGSPGMIRQLRVQMEV